MERVKLGFWWIKKGKEGSLSKGKIHCSCSSCSTKVKKDGWHKNDKSKLNLMKKDIEDYYKETE
ncbi:hypothetical protein D3C85_1633510 [compost metagenome]